MKKSSALYQLRWVTRILAVVILALVLIGMMLSSQYHIERSVYINASEKNLSSYIGDLESWGEWVYLQDGTVFKQPSSTKEGASDRRLLIENTDSEDGLLEVSLMEADKVEFSVVPKVGVLPISNRISWSREGQGVRVVWVVEGELNAGLMSSYIALFANDIAGSNLETSLVRLKNRF